MEPQLQMVNSIIDAGSEFAIAYGLQLIGALVILLIGLRVAGFFGRRIAALCERRNLDVTLSRFAGNAVKIVLVVIVVIITLSNFGIDIAPLVALGGAAAFGISFAVQGALGELWSRACHHSDPTVRRWRYHPCPGCDRPRGRGHTRLYAIAW